ncbi:MAG: type II secretion protein F [Planctomycetaceae bacterium]|nr:type II secretion protein F [Planctomycetaceae bacterium]
MPTYQFMAMDKTGQEIKDEIEADNEDEAQAIIRQQGYFVTKIAVKKIRKQTDEGGRGKRKKSLAIGGVSSKALTAFTRQLSILQDAGLPILRSLRILEGQMRPGKLQNAVLDTCEDIEAGSTLSEALSKSPRVFNRLYINMIRAGEAGGALEVILRRLSEFMERAESLKRKVKGAMIYPCVVVLVAVSILAFIMIKIVPQFEKIFLDFGSELPPITVLLTKISHTVVDFWWLIPGFPIFMVIFVKIIRKFRDGRMGWDMFMIKLFVIGPLLEKNILARSTRTLGTLVSSGVPILEGLAITRETCGNAVFERMFSKIGDAIRDGDTISNPMKQFSKPGFHPVAMFFWVCLFAMGPVPFMFVPELTQMLASLVGGLALVGVLAYLVRMNGRIVDDIVVNMVDVGEETGELDTMLYKVADENEETVRVMTDGLVAILEPLLIVFLGFAVGFIVIALFMPLVQLITELS